MALVEFSLAHGDLDNVPDGSNHRITDGNYADDASRLAEASLSPDDVDKVFSVGSGTSRSYWIAQEIVSGVPSWVRLDGSGLPTPGTEGQVLTTVGGVWGAADPTGGGGEDLIFSADAFAFNMVLGCSVTSTTPAVLSLDGAAASALNQLVLADGEVVSVTGDIVATNTNPASTNPSAWTIRAVLKKRAGNNVLYLGSITATSNSAGWGLTAAANTSLSSLSLTFTGSATFTTICIAHLRCVKIIDP